MLGATGSVGRSVLDVVAQHPRRYQVFALVADRSVAALAEQCRRFRPRYAAVRAGQAPALARLLSRDGLPTEALGGARAACELAAHDDTDIAVAAISGSDGLLPTMAAVAAGKRVLLANKEALVMAGALLMRAARESGATLLPVDSEHNGVLQCLPASPRWSEVRRIVLTASGGPFLDRSPATLSEVTPEQATAHPNWVMGRKISVDSATMMNKGLERIEARWLFDLPAERIDVALHPQSIVHALVEYRDGSVLAQLAQPDMRVPIAHALAWPERLETRAPRLDLTAAEPLRFAEIDRAQFPCLALAERAAAAGAGAQIALNAANEAAVHAFLARRLRFTDIAWVIDAVLDSFSAPEPGDIDAVRGVDWEARRAAERLVARRGGPATAAKRDAARRSATAAADGAPTRSRERAPAARSKRKGL